jgi:hypothetical protein
MKRHRSLSHRRAFLKGAGSILIGLPLLEEAVAQNAVTPPRRMLTLSFGLGIEKALQDEQNKGPLAPLLTHQNKLMQLSNLQNSALSSDGTAHFKVAGAQFTGKKQPNDKQAGGASLEQIMRQALHPAGVPSVTGLPSYSAGIWSRTGSVTQYCRHWNADGTPGALPQRRPSKVFDALFGRYGAGAGDGTSVEARLQRSILDSVLVQYQSLTGPNSYLGADSKNKIRNHLEQIRAIEKELAATDGTVTQIEVGESGFMPPTKTDFADPTGIAFYDAQSGPTTGPQVAWQDAQKAFRLTADLFALGLQGDALRFGSLIFVGAGEHLRFTGRYTATGIDQSLDFSTAFANSSPHDAIFHNYVQSAVRVYQHYVISQLAYVLTRLDTITEANGKTLLDNCCVLIGTEYGKNHDEGSDIFHAVAGGDGLFKTGRITTAYSINDVYKTLLDAYGITHTIAGKTVTGLRV